VLRSAINYTMDKHAAPQTLQALVTGQYLKEIPTDPFLHQQQLALHFGESLLGPGQTVTGINDVHSASTLVSRDGTPYDTW
jgi:hypothetical protein